MIKFNKVLILVLVVILVALTGFAGCGNGNYSQTDENTAQLEEELYVAEEFVIEGEALPMANDVLTSQFLIPEASGIVVNTMKNTTMDSSNSSQGYIMLKYLGSNPKIKVQITRSTGTTYTYDLNARNAYEVFPLSDGDGSYMIKLFENISGTKYSQAFSKTIAVKLENQFLPFLYPNQYVNFGANSETVKKGIEITSGVNDSLAKIDKIYNYVVGNFVYDKEKAATVKSGYLPDVDTILASKKGICFDYASVMTSMLRSQNIPSKLVVGYTGNVYHAWINVYTEETGWVDGMIFFDGNNWELMDPTFASSAKKSTTVMKYIGNGNNYTSKYTY